MNALAHAVRLGGEQTALCWCFHSSFLRLHRRVVVVVVKMALRIAARALLGGIERAVQRAVAPLAEAMVRPCARPRAMIALAAMVEKSSLLIALC